MLPNRSRPDENPTTVFRPRCPTPSFPDGFCHWPQRVLCSKRFRRVVGSQEDGTAMLQVVWHSFQAGAPVWTFLGRTCFGIFWVDTMHMPHNMVSTFWGGQPLKKQVRVPKTSSTIREAIYWLFAAIAKATANHDHIPWVAWFQSIVCRGGARIGLRINRSGCLLALPAQFWGNLTLVGQLGTMRGEVGGGHW